MIPLSIKISVMITILLPTDFSENSKNAIRYALDFFHGKKCTFYFFNVQKISEYVTAEVFSSSPKNFIYDAVISDNKEMLNSLMHSFKEVYKSEDYTFHSKVDFDTITDAITQTVSLYNIDLIIMGTNGATSTKEVLFGSNTLNVVRQVETCTVLTIPENYTYKKVESILFSLHEEDILKKEKLKPLFNLMAVQEQPHLQILNIEYDAIKDPDTIENEHIQSTFKNGDYTFHSLTNIPTPFAINAFVQLFNVSLHAMFLEKESLLERFIFGSETSKISYGSRIPLLVMHP